MSRVLMVLMLVPLWAQALEPGPSSPAQAVTETWLRIQGNNEQASQKPQVVTPAQRDLSMQRWLDAHKYQLPEVYKWEKVESEK